MEIDLRNIEKELRTAGSKGDLQKYFDLLGEALVEVVDKVIEIDEKLKIMNNEVDKVNTRSLSVKGKKEIERIMNEKKNLTGRLNKLETEFQQFKNQLGR